MTGPATFKQHYFYIKRAADLFKVPATLDLTTSIIKLAYPNTHQAGLLLPQFSKVQADNKRIYNAFFEQMSDRFAGWRPYTPISIDLLGDKLALKKRLLVEGCLAPHYSETLDTELTGFIIKPRSSSFSQNIFGPFSSKEELVFELEKNYFIEQFIPGEIVKIWYLNAQPSCIELADMPAIVGDGNKSIRALVIELLNQQINPQAALFKSSLINRQEQPKEIDQTTFIMLAKLKQMLAFQGCHLDAVPLRNQRLLLDFRYMHVFPRGNAAYCLAHCERDFSALDTQLQKIGHTIQTILNEAHCPFLIYTVDAILDNNGQLWVLETNTNPMMHPFVYEDLVRHLVHQNQHIQP